MTRAEYNRRVARLARRYPSLFSDGHIGRSIAPGWLRLIEELCERIDSALAEAEKGTVHIQQIKEKFGTLRFYLNVEPPRIDLIAPGSVVSVKVVLDGDPQGPPTLYARLAPLVSDAENASAETCLFCGAPGRLRRDREWLLTLCDRHSNCTYRHLKVAFEQMTDPDRDIAPPDRETVTAALRAAADEFRALGIPRLGLLPPKSAAGVWRLAVVGEASFEACRAAEALLCWPFEVDHGFRDSDRKTGAEEVTWILGERP